jgi:hypothetical protein
MFKSIAITCQLALVGVRSNKILPLLVLIPSRLFFQYFQIMYDYRVHYFKATNLHLLFVGENTQQMRGLYLPD